MYRHLCAAEGRGGEERGRGKEKREGKEGEKIER